MRGPAGIFWASLTPFSRQRAPGESAAGAKKKNRMIRILRPSTGEHANQVDLGQATLSFYTVTDYHWLSLVRDLHSNLAVIGVVFCPNDSVTPG
jgi:hypothetical protein